MKKVYIGFSKAKSKWAIFSKLIMWVEQTPFSHVYIKMDSDYLERSFIYQASGTKVNFENIPSFLVHSEVIQEFNLNVSPEVYKKIFQFAIDNVGKPYSLKQVIVIGWTRLRNWLGLPDKSPYKNRTDAFVCSEVGAYILEIDGKKILENKDILGPKEVFALLTNN